MRNTSRDRRNKLRLRKIGNKLRQQAKQRKKERHLAAKAAKPAPA
jgi:hypothetical protein